MRARQVSLALFALLASFASGQITINQTDTFQDGTTQSWLGGASPTNVPNGGPLGTGDKFLQLTSGFQNKLASYNIARWGGNYVNAGVNRVEVDLKNLGATDLTVRLILFGPLGNRWSSNTGVALPVGSTWIHATFDLEAANFTHTQGTGTFNDALTALDRMMFRHEVTVSTGGTAVTGSLGIDNVAALSSTGPRTLSITSLNPGSGVAMTVWKPDKNGASNGVTPFDRVYDNGFSTSVTAPATASGGTKAFDHWEKDGISQGALKTVNVVMNAAHTIRAVYVPVFTMSFTSTNPASGVPITVYQADLSGLKNGTTSFSRQYRSGTIVSITAPASAGGNFFARWEKDGVAAGTAKTISITMNAAHTMNAVYVAGETLTVNSTGAASVPITLYQRDLNGAQNGTTSFTRLYGQGANVGVTAPGTSGGKTFIRWNLDGVSQGSAKTIVVPMGTNHTITAVYG